MTEKKKYHRVDVEVTLRVALTLPSDTPAEMAEMIHSMGVAEMLDYGVFETEDIDFEEDDIEEVEAPVAPV